MSEAEPATVDLRIQGMTCASCVRRVERTLARVEGVTAATVNLAAGRAVVQLSQTVETERLLRAVEGAGYAADLAEPQSGAAAEPAGRRARRQAELRGRAALLAV